MTKAKASGLNPTEKMESVSKDADFRSLYINNVQFGMTRFDFQMILGIVEVTKDPNYQSVRELASVKMTHAYAKALLTDMKAVIEAYEKQFGAISLPADLKD